MSSTLCGSRSSLQLFKQTKFSSPEKKFHMRKTMCCFVSLTVARALTFVIMISAAIIAIAWVIWALPPPKYQIQDNMPDILTNAYFQPKFLFILLYSIRRSSLHCAKVDFFPPAIFVVSHDFHPDPLFWQGNDLVFAKNSLDPLRGSCCHGHLE